MWVHLSNPLRYIPTYWFSISGLEVNTLSCQPDESFSFPVPNNICYIDLLENLLNSIVHKFPQRRNGSFYLHWMCGFIFCVPGLRTSPSYVTLALHFPMGHKLALALLVLGALSRGLDILVEKKLATTTGGPLWLFQYWLMAYFPIFRGRLCP